jgi:3-hydroxybutyryl-CoA dehydrogenase
MSRMRIAVLGGGLMGAGIAQVFAVGGHEVAVFEPDAAARASLRERLIAGLESLGQARSAANRVTAHDSLAAAVADAGFVTEAAPEKLELKQALFAQLIEHAPANAILGSNSSVIPVSRIAHGLPTGERIVGTHWWNPAILIPLVEVIRGEHTSEATIAATTALLRSVGKVTAYVKKDVPGFIGNRLQAALWREAIAMVAEGICDARTLDECVKNSFGRRLAVLGPLENADLIGLDLTLDIHRTMIPELDRHDRPHELLDAMVAEGRLGFKTGEGFRAWTPEEMATLRADLVTHLKAARQEPGAP